MIAAVARQHGHPLVQAEMTWDLERAHAVRWDVGLSVVRGNGDAGMQGGLAWGAMPVMDLPC